MLTSGTKTLLKKHGVLNEAFIDYRTRAALRANAQGQQVVVTETIEAGTVPMMPSAAKVTDVIGLYLHPPERAAAVLFVDERSQIQALDRTQPLLPMRPGQPERRTHDYVRHGTATLCAALDIATGGVTGRTYARHRHQEFLKFLQLVAKRYPRGEVHLVLDHYRTHKHPEVNDWLTPHPHFKLHFTPTSDSWMNQVET